ncbi:MAG: hypothetical protein KDD35_00400, partial [Bdellovibrionales bacterium]|nr:hypothetical protein [Bdellovibrionales bacterium]
MNNRDILNISFVEFLKGLASSLALPSLALTLALGCDGHPSANLTAPPPSYQTDFKKGATIEIEYNPKLDVLFIIDNSKSMENEQAALIEAMDRFVDSFGENSLVDFRVGAISVFDSRKRALFQAQGLCRPEGTEKVEGDGKVECYPNGRLRAPFVSRDTGTKESLRQALQIGTLDTKDGGPRFEEIFSSILAAFNPEMNRENGNFIREDSRVVVIIVTDEGDLSPQLGVESFLAELKHL